MKTSAWKRAFSHGEVPALIIGLLMFLFFSFATKKFFTAYNIVLLFNQMAVYGMLGAGLTLVIIVGGMDISIGSTLSLCCSLMGMIWEYAKGLPNEGLFILLGAMASIGVGTLVGMLLGTMITFFRIPDMVASLALQRITRGIAIAISQGRALSKFPRSIYKLGVTKFLGIGLPFWAFLAFVVILTIILAYTRFGRRIYMMGNNATAANLAGVNVARTRFLVYSTEGLIVGLCSVIYLSYNFYAMASTTGDSILSYVLAAVLMGGASMSGGKGTTVGTLFGAFALGTIMNGLIHIGATANAVDIIVAITIMAVPLAQFLVRWLPGRAAGKARAEI